jgi:hypothetical protein
MEDRHRRPRCNLGAGSDDFPKIPMLFRSLPGPAGTRVPRAGLGVSPKSAETLSARRREQHAGGACAPRIHLLSPNFLRPSRSNIEGIPIPSNGNENAPHVSRPTRSVVEPKPPPRRRVLNQRIVRRFAPIVWNHSSPTRLSAFHIRISNKTRQGPSRHMADKLNKLRYQCSKAKT